MDNESNLVKLRSLIREAEGAGEIDTAVFLTDKLSTLCPIPDVYLDLARLYLVANEPTYAFALLERNNLLAHPRGVLLAARSKMSLSEWSGALQLLGEESMEVPVAESVEESEGVHLSAWACLLRGRCYAALDNRAYAQLCFEHALAADVRCVAAVTALAEAHMLSPQAAQVLVDRVARTDRTLGAIYALRLGLPCSEPSLHANTDVQAARAEALYERGATEEALEVTGEYVCGCRLTGRLLAADPERRDRALLVHVAALAEARRWQELFVLAHRVSGVTPEAALAHYVIGCYYYAAARHFQARAHFAKERDSGRYWLAYGHACAGAGEGEAALAAYRQADRLLAAAPHAALALAQELARAHHLAPAQAHLMRAQHRSPDDPRLLHEAGTLAYRNGQWTEAERLLRRAAKAGGAATLLNLAHAVRKLRRYEEAAALYRRASVECAGRDSLPTLRAQAMSGAGLCAHLLGQVAEAIEYYIRALALHPEEGTAKDMLPRAYEDHALLPV